MVFYINNSVVSTFLCEIFLLQHLEEGQVYLTFPIGPEVELNAFNLTIK